MLKSEKFHPGLQIHTGMFAEVTHAKIADQLPVTFAHDHRHVRFSGIEPIQRLALAAIGLEHLIGAALNQRQDIAAV